jgi:hypothetical protein
MELHPETDLPSGKDHRWSVDRKSDGTNFQRLRCNNNNNKLHTFSAVDLVAPHSYIKLFLEGHLQVRAVCLTFPDFRYCLGPAVVTYLVTYDILHCISQL